MTISVNNLVGSLAFVLSRLLIVLLFLVLIDFLSVLEDAGKIASGGHVVPAALSVGVILIGHMD